MSAPATANDRFKQSSRSSFWISLIVATVAHAAAFAGSPVFALDAESTTDPATDVVDLPPDLRLPEPPEPIRPPVAPVIAADAPTELTLDPVTPERWAARPLEAPPAGSGADDRVPFVTPMDVAPRLLNAAEVQRALQRHYPPVLREAGIGGVVALWFHIDERGRVMETRIQRASGYDDLDGAALAVADGMEFSPALNRDRRIPVWVALEIVFEVQR
ncbi:MAG TPA: energy transducer TonB [Longimicrobiales bacterium]|nr:energy transducer TonB [Longimicrobiales bacterium]